MNSEQLKEEISWLKPIIMAGGKGERLWPLSKSNQAKQFLNLIEEKSLIKQTYDRLTQNNKIDKDQIFFSTTKEQKKNILKQFPYLEKKSNEKKVIVEPFIRDTACAILLAALTIEKEKILKEDDVLFFLPADATISPNDTFFNDIYLAGQLAQKKDALVLLGVKPSYPATNYGYLKTKILTEKENKEILKLLSSTSEKIKIKHVLQFVEKPKIEIAQQYIKEKNYLWNTGMFFMRGQFLINLFQKHARDHFDLLSQYLELLKKDSEAAKKYFLKIKKISFDFAIAEKMQESIFVVPSSIQWDDLGNICALSRVMPTDKDNNLILGNAYQMNCENIICDARQSNKKIILHNLQNTVVVATNDTTYISNKKGTEEIKKLLAQMKKDNLDYLL